MEPGYTSSAGRSQDGAERALRPPATCPQLSSANSHSLALGCSFLVGFSSVSQNFCGQSSRPEHADLHGLAVLPQNGPYPQPWYRVVSNNAATPEAAEQISEISQRQSMKKCYSRNDCHLLLFCGAECFPSIITLKPPTDLGLSSPAVHSENLRVSAV